MSSTLIVYQQGAAATLSSGITFLGIGGAGDPDACRRLVYPSTVSPFLAPITYSVGPICKNPDRTLNLDNTVLTHPITAAIRTLGTTRVLRFETTLADIIVTEIWEGGGSEASMTTGLLRLFLEYLYNPPDVSVASPAYIQWEPRDRTAEIYNVELLSISVGGGSGEAQFDVSDIRALGGLENGGAIANAMDTLSTVGNPVGLVDREVRLRMKIVGLVP